jgi:hypothetical protein
MFPLLLEKKRIPTGYYGGEPGGGYAGRDVLRGGAPGEAREAPPAEQQRRQHLASNQTKSQLPSNFKMEEVSNQNGRSKQDGNGRTEPVISSTFLFSWHVFF